MRGTLAGYLDRFSDSTSPWRVRFHDLTFAVSLGAALASG
jgi:hypothetical protein